MDKTIYRLEKSRRNYRAKFLEVMSWITYDDWVSIHENYKKNLKKGNLYRHHLDDVAKFARKISDLNSEIEDAIEANPIIKMIDEIIACMKYLDYTGKLNDAQKDLKRNLLEERYRRIQGRPSEYSDSFIQGEYDKIKDTPETDRLYPNTSTPDF